MNARLAWQPKYEIGIASIDSQHRFFFDIFQRMHANKERKPMLRMLVKEIDCYAQFHFHSEENLLLERQYPDLEVHRKMHQHLLSHFRERTRDLAAESPDGLLLFLVQWIVDHIDEEDRKYAQVVLKPRGG